MSRLRREPMVKPACRAMARRRLILAASSRVRIREDSRVVEPEVNKVQPVVELRTRRKKLRTKPTWRAPWTREDHVTYTAEWQPTAMQIAQGTLTTPTAEHLKETYSAKCSKNYVTLLLSAAQTPTQYSERRTTAALLPLSSIVLHCAGPLQRTWLPTLNFCVLYRQYRRLATMMPYCGRASLHDSRTD